MTSTSLRDQIIRELDRLTVDQQKQWLDNRASSAAYVFAPGTPGEMLLAHMDKFEFAAGAVDEMMRAIDEGCEGIDWSGWLLQSRASRPREVAGHHDLCIQVHHRRASLRSLPLPADGQ